MSSRERAEAMLLGSEQAMIAALQDTHAEILATVQASILRAAADYLAARARMDAEATVARLKMQLLKAARDD